MDPVVYLAAVLALWNVIIFTLYGTDKRKAKNNKWRISERALIVCAFLMGGFGAFIGMKVFRHKTKHIKFNLLIPLAVIANIGVIALLFYIGVLTL